MTDSVSSTFDRWAAAADAIRATTKRLEKGAVLEAYFPTLDDAALPAAARFFSGIVFPRHDMRVTQVGGSLVAAAVAAVTGADPAALHARTVAVGDLGDTARALLAEAGREAPSGRTLAEMEAAFAELAATAGSGAKRALVERLLAPLGAREAQYAVKLLLGSGELRIGLKEAQVEEALARAFGHPLAAVRRANLLRGDVGEVAVLTRAGALASASLALFHPIGFMLAQPLATAEEIEAALPAPFAVEDKYDGIRAQAHVGRDEHTGALRVALFSRTLDEITRGYPEVVEALAALAGGAGGDAGREGLDGVVLDGELLAYDPSAPERARPFKDLQRRLGRKTLSTAMLADGPGAARGVRRGGGARDARGGRVVRGAARAARAGALAGHGAAPHAGALALDRGRGGRRVRRGARGGQRGDHRQGLRRPVHAGAARQGVDQAQEGHRDARRGDHGRGVGARAAREGALGLHVRGARERERPHAAQRGEGVQRPHRRRDRRAHRAAAGAHRAALRALPAGAPRGGARGDVRRGAGERAAQGGLRAALPAHPARARRQAGRRGGHARAGACAGGRSRRGGRGGRGGRPGAAGDADEGG
jgi:hypothetical protein